MFLDGILCDCLHLENFGTVAAPRMLHPIIATSDPEQAKLKLAVDREGLLLVCETYVYQRFK
jgi:hypothetical protein